MARRYLAGTSIAVLLIQLTLVGSIAGKYLYQRWSCPRVWTRAAVYDPETLMRGRYLALQLTVDGCRSTMPSALHVKFPRYTDGTTRPDGFAVTAAEPVRFAAALKVDGGKLLALRIEEPDKRRQGVTVMAPAGSACGAMVLEEPVSFYIAEHAASPTPLKAGQELWIEVTVPPKGPPRPLQLALKQDGTWTPLAFQ